MFSHFRRSLGLALLLALLTSVTVLAKGGFSFIMVTGSDLKEPVRITDTRLTEDFFAFANFYEDRVGAPTKPEVGYDITRYYIDGKREIAFDHLYYHPKTGYVFYDGIVNGSSEYDGDWYKANPDIAGAFESALSAQTQSVVFPQNSQSVKVAGQNSTVTNQDRIRMSVVITAGLALTLVPVYRFRIRRQAVR